MSDISSHSATCSSCGTNYPVELLHPLFAGDRPSCSYCEERAVALSMTTSDSTEIHEMISFKVKGERSGKRKIFHKGKSGDEFNHADQRWTVVSRNIDRDNNRYDELITEAATGTILREIHESLSEHRGRGSARRGHRS